MISRWRSSRRYWKSKITWNIQSRVFRRRFRILPNWAKHQLLPFLREEEPTILTLPSSRLRYWSLCLRWDRPGRCLAARRCIELQEALILNEFEMNAGRFGFGFEAVLWCLGFLTLLIFHIDILQSSCFEDFYWQEPVLSKAFFLYSNLSWSFPNSSFFQSFFPYLPPNASKSFSWL